jgi:hypothetical protein
MNASSLRVTVVLGLMIIPLVQAGEITTREGKTYHAAMVERVEPDGIILSYQPSGGGFGNAKLKFATLPENLQREYGYDPQKAADFEADQAHAQEVLQQKFWSEYEDATNRLALIRIEEEKLAEKEAMENTRLEAQKAQAEQERIAKEASIKKEIESAKRQPDYIPLEDNPYYVPDDKTGVISSSKPTTGFDPSQYQLPSRDGNHRPSLPPNQVPPVSSGIK